MLLVVVLPFPIRLHQVELKHRRLSSLCFYIDGILFVRRRLVDLMMEAVSTPESSLSFYDTIRRNIPEYSLTLRHENPTSYVIITCFGFVLELSEVIDNQVVL
jgi:hypothetical protein